MSAGNPNWTPIAPELRAEATELAKEIGVRPAARRLGLNPHTVQTWLRGRTHHPRKNPIDVAINVILAEIAEPGAPNRPELLDDVNRLLGIRDAMR